MMNESIYKFNSIIRFSGIYCFPTAQIVIVNSFQRKSGGPEPVLQTMGGLVLAVDQVLPGRMGRTDGLLAVRADLRVEVLVVSELRLAAAVGPPVCWTPNGGLAMPVATGILYLHTRVSQGSV
jgi:hypothetical protein